MHAHADRLARLTAAPEELAGVEQRDLDELVRVSAEPLPAVPSREPSVGKRASSLCAKKTWTLEPDSRLGPGKKRPT